MKNLLFALAATSTLATSARAALEMSPGLWEVNMKIKAQGQEIDPSVEIQKAMASMPPEQKKRMQEMMAKMGTGAGAGINSKGMQVCYTREMLEKEESIASQKDGQCHTNITTRTPKKIVADFSCKDGAKGTATWNIHDRTSYNGKVHTEDAKGKKGEISYSGKFINTDCGKIKPRTI